MAEESTLLVLILTSIGSLGTFSYLIWKVFDYLAYYVWKNYVVSLYVNTKDPIYDWIVLWLKRHGPINASNHWTIQTKNDSILHGFRPLVAEAEEEKLKKPKFEWRPRPATFLFKHYKTGQFMRLKIQKNEKENDEVGSDNGIEFRDWEVITLEMFGQTTKVIRDLVNEAHAEYIKQNEGKTVVYQYNNEGKIWQPFGKSKNKRPWII